MRRGNVLHEPISVLAEPLEGRVLLAALGLASPAIQLAFAAGANAAQPPVLTARFTPVNNQTATGTVTFKDGAGILRTVPLSNGSAALALPGFLPGTHYLTAIYNGDTHFAAATAPVLTKSYTAPSSVTLFSSADTAPTHQPVTFTAVVAAGGTSAAIPGGVVQFTDNGATLGAATLVNGIATLTAAFDTTGAHSIVARYQGDAGFGAASSNTITQTITFATVVDLLVLYTVRAANSVANIQNTIRQAVQDTNEAFLNSRINLTLRLVNAEQVSYAESSDYHSSLDRLQTPGDGYLDQAQTLRNQYGADLVSLFVGRTGTDGTIGLGSLLTNVYASNNANYGYTVVHAPSAPATSYTLAHELGHNLGATHDEENATGDGATSYSHGWRFTAGATVYHDIMSYPPGISIPYYSNPAVYYKGVPTGTTQTANVARTINETSSYVAAYRPTAIAASIATTVALASAVTQTTAGQTVTLTATVTSPSGSASPSGDVIFRDGNTLLGSASLINGTATWTGSLPLYGVRSLTAIYTGQSKGGLGDFTGGISAPQNVVVGYASLSADGALVVNGTSAADTIQLSSDAGLVNVVANGVTQTYPLSSISNITVSGLEGQDFISVGHGIIGCSIGGGIGADRIIGGDGHDTISGGKGQDSIDGGAGSDLLHGNLGDDTLAGGAGSDALYGDDGNDSIGGGPQGDILYGGDGADTLSGGKGHDVLYASAGGGSAFGGMGNDIMYAGFSSVRIFGQAGDDTIWARNGQSNTIDGGDGSNSAQVDDLLDLCSNIQSLLA